MDMPGPGSSSGEVNPDAVLVTVNGRSLNQAEADRRIRLMLIRQGMPPASADQMLGQLRAQFQPQVVSQFVDTVLLDTEAVKRGLTVSPAEVEAVLTNLAARLPDGMTLDAFAAERGTTLDAMRDQVGTGERIRKLYEAETVGVPGVGDDEISAFYTNNLDEFEMPASATASHILVQCEEQAGADAQQKARAKAEALRAQLLSGTNFADLAKAESDCPSAAKGGDLGTFGRGLMVPAFEEAAFSQEIGAIGPVVQTPFGYHIVKVTGRKESGTLSREEAGDKIREYLDEQKKNEKFDSFMVSLRASTNNGAGPTNAPAVP